MYCLAPAAEPKDADMPAVCYACAKDEVSFYKSRMRQATKTRGVDCGDCGTYIPRCVWPDNNPPSTCYMCECGKKNKEWIESHGARTALARAEDAAAEPHIIKALQAVFGNK